MKILITSPTSQELPPQVRYSNLETTLLITGVGGAATMYFLQKELNERSYDLVIQTGICGSYNIHHHPLNTVYSIQKDVFADVGIVGTNEFHPLVEMGFLKDEEKRIFQNGWLYNDLKISETLNIKSASAATVNSLTDSLHRKYDAGLESMEGAYFHYLCLLRNQRFLQLRSVSNEVGEKDKTKWTIQQAVQSLHHNVDKLLNQLNISDAEN